MCKTDIALINNIYMVVQHKLIVVHHQGISQDSLLIKQANMIFYLFLTTVAMATILTRYSKK